MKSLRDLDLVLDYLLLDIWIERIGLFMRQSKKRLITLKKCMERTRGMKTWDCGHKTSKAHDHWPICPICALEQGKYLEINNGLEARKEIESDRAMKEAIEWSKTFNRKGCPYCGGIF